MSQHAQRKHCLAPPSSGHRWAGEERCPASVLLAARAGVEDQSEYADEGEYAHEYIQWALSTGRWSVDDMPGARDKDSVEAVNDFLGWLHDLVAPYPDAAIYSEKRVTCLTHPENPVQGTCDVRIWIPSLRWLVVVDYKHGAGIYVGFSDDGPDVNIQLELYGIGALNEMPPYEHPDKITLVIFQPRCGKEPVRWRDVDVQYLGKRHAVYHQRMLEAYSENAYFNPTAKNCQFCPALLNCPFAAGKGLTLFQTDTFQNAVAAKLPEFDKLDPSQVVYVLEAIKVFRQWSKKFTDAATARARNGTKYPGMKMVEMFGSREMIDESPATIQELQRLTGLSQSALYKSKLLGIVELEETIKRHVKAMNPNATRSELKTLKEQAEFDFAKLTHRTGARLDFVPENDNRPAYQPTRITYNAPALPPPTLPPLPNGLPSLPSLPQTTLTRPPLPLPLPLPVPPKLP